MNADKLRRPFHDSGSAASSNAANAAGYATMAVGVAAVAGVAAIAVRRRRREGAGYTELTPLTAENIVVAASDNAPLVA